MRRCGGAGGLEGYPPGTQWDPDSRLAETELPRRLARLGLDRRFTFLTWGSWRLSGRQLCDSDPVRSSRMRHPVQLLDRGQGTALDFPRCDDRSPRTERFSGMLRCSACDVTCELDAAADGFVMSSAWEGLPMVLLEASASSQPAVATDVGGEP